MTTPLASIVITNYNYGRFLAAAIESALIQTYQPLEVIVVDDGSTDNSRGIIAGYGVRIKAVLKKNDGLASAFNAGFEASAGEIVCLLDSDDLFLPEKVREVMDVYQAHPEIGWCIHPLRRETAEGGIIGNTPGARAGAVDLRRQIRAGSIVAMSPPTTGLTFRRALLEKILPMPVVKGSNLDDNYLKIAAYFLEKGFFINRPLSVQRIHGSNLFSLNAKNKADRGRRSILAAYWLRRRFPETKNYANKLLAKGIAFLRQAKNTDEANQKLIEEYLGASSALDRLIIRALAPIYFITKRNAI
jgi:glycosyltransferase involved in cell wall biosynthesis